MRRPNLPINDIICRWGKDNIGQQIGSGSYRVVFQSEDFPDMVFKLGYWDTGCDCNLVEYFSYNHIDGIVRKHLAEAYACSPKGHILTMERVWPKNYWQTLSPYEYECPVNYSDTMHRIDYEDGISNWDEFMQSTGNTIREAAGSYVNLFWDSHPGNFGFNDNGDVVFLDYAGVIPEEFLRLWTREYGDEYLKKWVSPKIVQFFVDLDKEE